MLGPAAGGLSWPCAVGNGLKDWTVKEIEVEGILEPVSRIFSSLNFALPICSAAHDIVLLDFVGGIASARRSILTLAGTCVECVAFSSAYSWIARVIYEYPYELAHVCLAPNSA